jgi:PAS domain S-box-containing protein
MTYPGPTILWLLESTLEAVNLPNGFRPDGLQQGQFLQVSWTQVRQAMASPLRHLPDLDHHHPDVVLVDLPRDVAHLSQLQQLWADAALVVLLPDEADEGLMGQLLELGIDDFLWLFQLNGPRLRCTIQNLWRQRQMQRQIQVCHQLHDVFDQAIVGINQADRSGRFIRVNQRFCQLLGYTEAELLQLTYQAVTHPDDLPHQVNVEQQLFHREQEQAVFEKRYIAKDGSIVWTRVTLSIVWDDAKGPVSDLAIVEDISEQMRLVTERQQIEANLDVQQNLLRATLDNLPHMAWLKDREGRFITVNAAFGEACGLPPADLEGKTDNDIWPPELAAAYREDDREVMATGQQKRVEEPLTLVNGTQQWIDTIKTPILNEVGEAIGTVGVAIDITERKQAERALYESQSRFKGIFDQAAVGICLASTTGIALSVNQWFCDWLGYSAAELLQMPIANYSHPEDQGADEALMARLLAGDLQSFTLEKRFVHKSGQLRWANLTVSLVRGADGEPLYDIAIVQDIHERKQAELSLRNSEQRYGALADHAPVGIFRTDRQGNCIYFNPKWCELAGITAAEGLGRGWLRALHPDDRDRAAMTWYQAALNQTPFAGEFRFLQPDGRVVWFIAQAVAELDAGGEGVGYVGTVTDITARKQIETRLQDSEAELRGLFAAMDDVVLVLDRQGRFLKVLAANDAQLYRPSMDFLGQSITDIFPPEQAVLFGDHIHQVLNTQTAQEIDYCLTMDGVERCFSAKCSPITADQVIWVARDVTDNHQTQRALTESQARLQALFDNAAVGICQVAITGQIIQANQQFCDFVGYSEAELQQISYAAYTAPEDLAADEALMQRLIAGDIPNFTLEKRFIHRSGEVRWANLTVSLIWGDDGQPLYNIGVIEDIRDRKRQELLLEGQRRVLQGLAQGQPLPQVLTQLVETLEALIPGIQGSILLLKNNRLWHGATPSLPPSYVEAVNGVAIGPNVGSCGTAAYCKEPIISSSIATDPRWENFIAIVQQYDFQACWSFPIFSQTGQVLGSFGLYRQQPGEPAAADLDVITTAVHLAGVAIERKQTEAALQENQDFLQTILDNLPVSLFVKDATPERFGQYVLVNQTCETFWDQPREQLLGKTAQELFSSPAGRGLCCQRSCRVNGGEKTEF